MSSEAFNKVMHGLNEAQAFAGGKREGYKVTAPGPITSLPKLDRKADLTEPSSDRPEHGLNTAKRVSKAS